MSAAVNLATSLGRHAAIYGAGILLQRVAGFLMLPLYTRRLSQADYGLISIIDFTVGLVALVVGLNLAEALIRIYNEKDDESWRARSVATTVVANALLAGLGALVLSLGAGSLGPAIFGCPVPPHLVALAAATMALDAVATPCFTYLRLLDRSGTFVLVSLARLTIAVTINLVWLGGLRGGITAYFASNVVASLLQGAFLVGWTLRRVSLGFSREALAQLLRFSLPLVPASVCSLVLHRSSSWVLARFGAAEALGVFGVAYQLGNVVSNGFVQPFSLVWSTKIYEVLRLRDGAALVGRVFIWFAFCVTWGAVGLSLLARPLLAGGFVGARFQEAASAVPLVAFAYVLFGLGFVVHMGVFIAKKTERSLDAASRAAVASILLNVLGAAVARDEQMYLVPAVTGVLSFAVLAVLRYRYAQELYPLPYDWKRAAALVALGAGFVAAAECMTLPFAAALALRVLLSLAFAPAAVLLMPPRERAAARALLFETARARTALWALRARVRPRSSSA
jgi:O-antigen/teichoic acid export membrane protein